jgi:enterochelin esterase-like enzyme
MNGGDVVFEGIIRSSELESNRTVRIYLPPGYGQTSARYPVIYFQDGQNAFSTDGPKVAFGWGNWELDKTADRLISEGLIEPLIIVGIDCGASRYREYRGPVPANMDNRAYERYGRFLLNELKPKLDAEYRTKKDPANTGLLGSSMGGIFSIAMAWEHPNVFGKAASLSGAFQVEKGFFLFKVLQNYSSQVKPVRIYLDSGVTDYTGGDDGAALTAQAAEQFRRIGWDDHNLMHFVDPPLTAQILSGFDLADDKRLEAERSQHNELYWRLRVWRALSFLFPPSPDRDFRGN